MVYRVFVEKKEGLRVEANALLTEIRDLLGISSLKSLRLLNRYDAEKIEIRFLFDDLIAEMTEKIEREEKEDVAV